MAARSPAPDELPFPVPSPCLVALLGRAERHRFLTDYWRRRTYRSRRPFAPELGKALALNVLAFKRAACIAEHGSLRAYGRSRAGVPQEVVIRPEQIDGLFWAGQGVALFNLERVHPPVLAVLRTLRDELGLVGDISSTALFSPPGAATALHFDEISSFNLQLQGTKSWHFADEPAVCDPSVAVKIDVIEAMRERHPWIPPPPRLSKLRRSVQAPGDVLFQAPGTWHQVTSSDVSLSVTLNFHPRSRARSLADLLFERLNQHEAWRLEGGPATEPATRRPYQRESSPDDDVLALATKLEERLAQATVPAVESSREPDGRHAPQLPNRSDVYRVIHPFKFDVMKGSGNEVEVVTATRAFVLGSEATSLLEKLATMDCFAAGDVLRWPPRQRMVGSWREARTLVAEIVELGLIERVRSK